MQDIRLSIHASDFLYQFFYPSGIQLFQKAEKNGNVLSELGRKQLDNLFFKPTPSRGLHESSEKTLHTASQLKWHQ